VVGVADLHSTTDSLCTAPHGEVGESVYGELLFGGWKTRSEAWDRDAIDSCERVLRYNIRASWCTGIGCPQKGDVCSKNTCSYKACRLSFKILDSSFLCIRARNGASSIGPHTVDPHPVPAYAIAATSPRHF
jgi:hypothetical protein